MDSRYEITPEKRRYSGEGAEGGRGRSVRGRGVPVRGRRGVFRGSEDVGVAGRVGCIDERSRGHGGGVMGGENGGLCSGGSGGEFGSVD